MAPKKAVVKSAPVVAKSAPAAKKDAKVEACDNGGSIEACKS